MPSTLPSIAAPTMRSLRLRMYAQALTLGTATGFVVNHRGRPFLVTNHHVIIGQNALTGEFLGDRAVHPESVEIAHHAAGRLGSHVLVSEPLYDQAGRALWIEHPTYGERVDVVALPLTQTRGVDLHPHNPWDTDPAIALYVTSDVSVVGFPFGRSSNDLPIWARGTIASEIELDHDSLPLYLIDSRTRKGQSGSPVVYYVRGMVSMQDGSLAGVSQMERFVGVYSGRISEESDIGMVWKPPALIEIIESEHRSDVRNGNLI